MNSAMLKQWGRGIGFTSVALGVYIALLYGSNVVIITVDQLGRAGAVHPAWVFVAILCGIVMVFLGLWISVMAGKLLFGHPMEYEEIEIDAHIELTPEQDRRLMHGYVLFMALIMMPCTLYANKAWETFVKSETGSQYLYEVFKHVGFPVVMVVSMSLSFFLIHLLMIRYRRRLAVGLA